MLSQPQEPSSCRLRKIGLSSDHGSLSRKLVVCGCPLLGEGLTRQRSRRFAGDVRLLHSISMRSVELCCRPMPVVADFREIGLSLTTSRS